MAKPVRPESTVNSRSGRGVTAAMVGFEAQGLALINSGAFLCIEF
jgi:hypothetical protein